MSTRKYTHPRDYDVSRGLQEVLNRNGIQAHLSMTPTGGYQLVVLGHDSPVITYDLNSRQVDNLMGWGTNSANRKAYGTFTSIVRNDFHMPDNFVSARNAFGKVAMGLHGYRIGPSSYSTPVYRPFTRHTRGWGGDFLGWGSRFSGWHMRRIEGRTYFPSSGMIPVRPDGRLKPGELNAGGYGFYYKGQREAARQDVFDRMEIENKMPPVKAAERPVGKGIRYDDEIKTDVYFTNDKFQKVLASHGIVVDAEKKSLLIQSTDCRLDLRYDLHDDELRKLTAQHNSGKHGVSVEERLAVINDIIKADFTDKVTMADLNTSELVAIALKPEIKEVVEAPLVEQERLAEQKRQMEMEREARRAEERRIAQDPQAINGKDITALMENKGWFQPVANGRAMVVGEIRVDNENGKYTMSADINGKIVKHEISEKDFEKFIALDDRHRLKLFDNIFTEVDIKPADGRGNGDDLYWAKGGAIVDGREQSIEQATSNKVDGAMLAEINERKGFYREIAHGREVEVRNIEVEKVTEGKFRMTAVINGESITHEITQKEFDKFMAVDDYQRMKLFSKIFNEVDMKTRPGQGVNIGAALLAAVVATGEVLVGSMPPPDLYEERRYSGSIYAKKGGIEPEEVVAGLYNSYSQHDNDITVNRGRGV